MKYVCADSNFVFQITIGVASGSSGDAFLAPNFVSLSNPSPTLYQSVCSVVRYAYRSRNPCRIMANDSGDGDVDLRRSAALPLRYHICFLDRLKRWEVLSLLVDQKAGVRVLCTYLF